MKFEWDKNKAASNEQKHSVSFDEAQTVFDDEWSSYRERRELMIGHSDKGQLLIVSFIERMQDIIRIISARPVTTNERKDYEKHRRI